MNIKLDGFKKVHSDKTHTILEHETDGHQIKLAHKALSKPNRKALEKLPLLSKDDSQSMLSEDNNTDHFSKPPRRYDDGGAVQSQPTSKPDYTGSGTYYPKTQSSGDYMTKDAKPSQTVGKAIGYPMADGGQIHGDKPIHAIKRTSLGEIKHKQFADGGDVADDSQAPDNGDLAALQQGVSNFAAQPSAMSASQQAPQQVAQTQQPPQAEAAQQKADLPQLAPASTQKSEDMSQESPDIMQGYQNQVQGVQKEANAQAQLGNQQQDIYAKQAGAQANLLAQTQAHEQDLWKEYNGLHQDIADGHIDPNHFMGSKSTIGRISTGIGLILGGLGSSFGGGPNQALSFLNSNIDRDIEAQKADLGKKENLLSANMRQFGNMRDATDMTKAMMQGMAANQLGAAGAKAQSPLAQGHAQQVIGQLQQQIAPTMQTLAMRKTLMGGVGQPGAGSQQDPASFVQYVVPESHQKEVFTEIKNAQNAAKNHDTLMQQFDKANKDNTIANRAAHLGFQPASVLAMNAAELPMIHDQEGRVNEYEQKTLSDLHPLPGDTDAKVKQKRAAYENFILNKQAAPTAKGFGIDLSKFQSTSPTPQIKVVNGIKYMRGPNGEAVKVP